MFFVGFWPSRFLLLVRGIYANDIRLLAPSLFTVLLLSLLASSMNIVFERHDVLVRDVCVHPPFHVVLVPFVFIQFICPSGWVCNDVHSISCW